MRLLGLDLGERRIGLAVTDASGMLATPTGYLVRTRLKQDISLILDIARQREVQGIVVGIPFTLAGKLGTQAKQAQGFIRHLKNSTTLPVYTVDERFTSFEAEAILRDAGQQPSRHRGAIDAAAATLLLQRFLDQAKQ
jgi:putative Holliday junction resolvase